MLLHNGGCQLANVATGYNPPRIQNCEFLGDGADKVQILLYEENGAITFRRKAFDDWLNLLHTDGCNPSVGSSMSSSLGS